MLKIGYFSKLISLCVIVIFGIFLILKPEICENSVAAAIILCGRVLIPSLFPFSVCMIFIIKSGIADKISFLNPITTKLFGLSVFPFSIMVLSMLGGYPIGAKLISESVKNGDLTPLQGKNCLNFCVNAGPGFIVSAVGNGLLGSKKIGLILLSSHILASIIMCIFSKKIIIQNSNKRKEISIPDNFVISAGESASATISICGFVILFSVITSYLEYFSQNITVLKPLLYLTEVTNAVAKTNNIYLISFLLGFSGICIWCQVLSVGKNLKINISSFALFRFLHGFLSALITFILLKIFPIHLTTFSSGNLKHTESFIQSEALGIALLILGLTFVISISFRQKTTKILEEMI